MTTAKRTLLTAAVAVVTMLGSVSAEAFFGPFSWMRSGMWGPGWGGWGGPWYGYGYPYYGGWGYPYYGYGYPHYGGWGYPYYGGWWGYPYGLGYPLLTAPAVVTQPAAKAEK